MEQQQFFEGSVRICQRRSFGTGGIRQFLLSDANLMILGFSWIECGAHFHLYQKNEFQYWHHIGQANTLAEIIAKAQPKKTANPSTADDRRVNIDRDVPQASI